MKAVGSELHMYEGRTSLEPGKIIGHENLGEIIEIGDAVVQVKVGDRVCLPFNISCGFCRNCERGLTGFCLTVNPGTAGSAYGYADMGPYAGGQAELLRVPFADVNCLVLPEDVQEREADDVMLADIFPTGYHATELADVGPGDSVVNWQAHDPQGHEVPNITMNNLVASVRPTGIIGVVGVFVPEDPQGPDAMARKGQIAFDWCLYFTKGLRMGSGQANVKAYNRQLMELITLGKATPSFIVSHHLPLERAPEAYEHFDRREDGWPKVVLRPAA